MIDCYETPREDRGKKKMVQETNRILLKRPALAHPCMLVAAWVVAAGVLLIAQQSIWSPEFAAHLRGKLATPLLIYGGLSAVLYWPLMMWLHRRGDAPRPGHDASWISFVLLGAGTYWVPLFVTQPLLLLLAILPERPILPLAIAFAAGGATYGAAFALMRPSVTPPRPPDSVISLEDPAQVDPFA